MTIGKSFHYNSLRSLGGFFNEHAFINLRFAAVCMPESRKNPLLNYFQESYEELKKVTWPTRNKAIRLTGIVLSFCFATALIIGMLDAGFNLGYRSLVLYSGKIAPPKVESPLKVDNVQATANTQQSEKTTPPEPIKKSSATKK